MVGVMIAEERGQGAAARASGRPHIHPITGYRYLDPAPLLACFANRSTFDIAAALGVCRETVTRWRTGRRHLKQSDADRHATAVGRHPSELWPEWWDLA